MIGSYISHQQDRPAGDIMAPAPAPLAMSPDETDDDSEGGVGTRPSLPALAPVTPISDIEMSESTDTGSTADALNSGTGANGGSSTGEDNGSHRGREMQGLSMAITAGAAVWLMLQ